MKIVRLFWFVLFSCPSLWGAVSEEGFRKVERPFNGEGIALSADGQHLAYSAREGGRFLLKIVNLSTGVTTPIPLGQSAESGNQAPHRLLDLRWTPTGRLVVENDAGAIVALDSDGGNRLPLWAEGENAGYGWQRGGGGSFIPNPRYGQPMILTTPGIDPDKLLIVDTIKSGNVEVAPKLVTLDVRSEARVVEELFEHVAAPQFITPGHRQFVYDLSGRPRLHYPPYANEMEDASVKGHHGTYERNTAYTTVPDRKFYVQLEPRSWRMLPLDESLGSKGKPEFDFEPKNFFGERSFPLGFDYDPEVLYYASNVGRDTWAVRALDLRTKERRDVAAVEGYDLTGWTPEESRNRLVFDDAARRLVGIRYTGAGPATLWLDPEISRLQADLDARVRPQTAEIREWSRNRETFLVRISAPVMPGSFAIFRPAANQLEKVVDEAPWLKPDDVFSQAPFFFTAADGAKLSGYITLPKETKIAGKPPTVMVHLRSGPWDRQMPGFDRDAQALASMGMIVMRLNVRGTGGFGRAFLESALKGGLDTVPLADIRAAIKWLADRTTIDRTRVVLMGEGYGAYLALRAIQLAPAEFPCAVALNGPSDLAAWASEHQVGEPTMRWLRPPMPARVGSNYLAKARATYLKGSGRRIEDISPLREPMIKRAIFFIEDNAPTATSTEWNAPDGHGPPPASAALRNSDSTPRATGDLSRRLKGEGTTVEYLRVDQSFAQGAPDSRLAVFKQIDEFIIANAYTFSTSIGELRVLPDQPTADSVKK